ncbi:MAG: hypothetical protein HY318_09980 [Armatimonadetes bacterium]|nr:hypothetical protein [Armatimonadota bacterium]
MPLSYGAIERKNPQRPEDPSKFYAQAESRSAVSLEEEAEEVAREMGMGLAVAQSALNAVGIVQARHLLHGDSVPTPHVGRIGVVITSDGTATPEELARVKKEKSLYIRMDSELRADLDRESDVFNGNVTRLPQTP